jgi:hypothetical protein
MVPQPKSSKPTLDTDALLTRAAEAQRALTGARERLLAATGLTRDQLARETVRVERHPVRGRELARMRRELGGSAGSSSSIVRQQSTQARPRGLRA